MGGVGPVQDSSGAADTAGIVWPFPPVLGPSLATTHNFVLGSSYGCYLDESHEAFSTPPLGLLAEPPGVNPTKDSHLES